MRWLFVVAAVIFAGCAASSAPEDGATPPATATSILAVDEILIGPGSAEARLAFRIPGAASSGTIWGEVVGTATDIEIRAPDACDVEDVVAPGPTGSAWFSLDCGAMAAGEGELWMLAPVGGTVQGRWAFAVTMLVETA